MDNTLTTNDNGDNTTFDLLGTSTAPTRLQTIVVHHWTALKLTNIAASREMIFPSLENELAGVTTEGLTKAISCSLANSSPATGETAKVRYVQFDANYVKYQFQTLFRDIFFDSANSVNNEDETAELIKLFVEAVTDYNQELDCLIDAKDTAKAIKSKDVTVALKKKYSKS